MYTRIYVYIIEALKIVLKIIKSYFYPLRWLYTHDQNLTSLSSVIGKPRNTAMLNASTLTKYFFCFETGVTASRAYNAARA